MSVFQSSPVPEDGRYWRRLLLRGRLPLVSILARPGGRALLVGAQVHPIHQLVSILARPGGRALPRHARRAGDESEFQSSPVPEDGRYAPSAPVAAWYTCFNPRPSRRTGATGFGVYRRNRRVLFQSSPVPEDGRYCAGILRRAEKRGVSILARPGGRALRSWGKILSSTNTFQSSPVPEDGRYSRPALGCNDQPGFNPRPSRRTGATLVVEN